MLFRLEYIEKKNFDPQSPEMRSHRANFWSPGRGTPKGSTDKVWALGLFLCQNVPHFNRHTDTRTPDGGSSHNLSWPKGQAEVKRNGDK